MGGERERDNVSMHASVVIAVLVALWHEGLQ